MTIQEIKKAYNRITGFLDTRELKNAFDSLQSLIAGSREYLFQDKIEEFQETYKYMLRYRSEGVKDPMQEQIYTHLLISTYEIADRIRNRLLTPEAPSTYYSQRRIQQSKPDISFEKLYTDLYTNYDIGNEVQYEWTLGQLFNKIWTSDIFTTEDYVSVKKVLDDDILPDTAGSQVVSALMLGLQFTFDKEKMKLLLDAAALSNEEIRIRALISVLIILYLYKKRIPLYKEIENRLDNLAEKPGFTNDVRTITLRFILARETEKITRRLQDEIIPEMMKLSPKISRKINLSDINPEQLGDEMNPEWQNIISDSSLGKKMEEFSELQQEGADVMHSTFIRLKSFPFFREISNWFLPFTADHSIFSNIFRQGSNEKRMLDSMTGAGFMCNSDKYSLYFSMMQLPEQHRKMMMGQFDSQASEMLQQNQEELITKRGKFEIIAGQYIQDLYRFYKLYPAHLDFEDIFSLPLDFHNLDTLSPYISDEESLTTIVEYYLRKNYFQDALVIYNRLAETNKDNEVLFQKIGYCKQMLGGIKGALAAYLHADLLDSKSEWVIRKIAGCYRTLKMPKEALTYYHRYEQLNPDNLSVQISIGHCHLELKEYNEALKYYFKVDYLDPKGTKAWRPIAWCSFLTGKYDQAKNYYHKILENNPNMQDYLNAGHTEWALQNIQGAIHYYSQAMRSDTGDFYKFQEQFMQDIPDLVVAGIEETEVPLMLDLLRYTLSNTLQ